MFAIDHYADDENFTSPLITKINGSTKKVKFKVNDASVSTGSPSDGNVLSTVPNFSEEDTNNNLEAVSEEDSTLDNGTTKSNVDNAMK